MTQREISKKIQSSTNPEWFKEKVATFIYQLQNKSIERKGYGAIFQHIDSQYRGWESIKEGLPDSFKYAKKVHVELRTALIELLNQAQQGDINQIQNFWNRNIISKITNFSDNQVIKVDEPETKFLINLNKESDLTFHTAFQYMFKPKHGLPLNTPENFEGAIAAYEYRSSGKEKLNQKNRYVKSDLNTLKNDFNRYYNETQEFIDSFTKKTSDSSSKHIEKIEKLLSKKQSEFENWFNVTVDQEKDFHEDRMQRLDDAEDLYRNLLNLKEPATFWSDRARSLKKEGLKWLVSLIISIILSVVILSFALYLISDGTLNTIFSKTGHAVRWSIVFVTLISFLAFAIRTFSKLVFSTYHLVRDAEERKQLVYVYLALKAENAVDEKERLLVLQSIFSRADSGLLKDDSSPTMPGSAGIIEKLMK